MKKRLKRLVIWFLGWTFILLGIAGLFLPILQGILFLLIGLSLLSAVSPWAHRLLERLKARFPRVSEQLAHAGAKARDIQSRAFARLDDVRSKVRELITQSKRKGKQPGDLES